jgi:serine/threonine-protein kinase
LRKEDSLLGNTLTDKYRIEEKLAEGGMGCVYRATHVLMEKTVAIKVLHPALAADEKIVARFTREAKAASRISHPHALTVTDFGEDKNGVVFLVMEYLRGRTLKEVIRDDGPMPLRRVVEIVRQVCGALEAAHAEGVVHRDLKSDNIMLEESSGGDWAKVLDFGIAKIKEHEGAQDAALTAPNLIIGTPQYMSPEQCSQASEIDSRSDIYSLGVIIYEMLAGHVPFTGESPTAIMVKHLQDAPPSILEEREDLPAEVGRIVAQALAKKPEDRFQKAGQLSDALAQVAANDVSSASAPGTLSNTDRIIVPTTPNEAPRATGSAVFDDDEATVVSGEVPTPRGARVDNETAPPFVGTQPPPPAQNLNPWRIAIPALIALAVVFVVVFALQRGSSSGEDQGPPLPTDPNSQPAQSLTPPTGSAETNIVPSTNAASKPPSVSESVNGTTTNSNQEAETEASPLPGEGVATNANQSRPQNSNVAPEPSPESSATPSNRNSNRRAPVINANTDDIPPPAPPPTKKETPPPAATPSVKIDLDDAAPVNPRI